MVFEREIKKMIMERLTKERLFEQTPDSHMTFSHPQGDNLRQENRISTQRSEQGVSLHCHGDGGGNTYGMCSTNVSCFVCTCEVTRLPFPDEIMCIFAFLLAM
jgi:hypothetical protein